MIFATVSPSHVWATAHGGRYALIRPPWLESRSFSFVCLCLAAAVPAYGQGFWGQQGGWGQGSLGGPGLGRAAAATALLPAGATPGSAAATTATATRKRNPRRRKTSRRLLTMTCSGSPRSSARCTSCAAFAARTKGQKWRNEAQVLIDTEAPNGERHEQMIASFNRGYRALPAELSHLHAGGRLRHPPLSRRRRQDRPRDHGALRQLRAGSPACRRLKAARRA